MSKGRDVHVIFSFYSNTPLVMREKIDFKSNTLLIVTKHHIYSDYLVTYDR